MTLPTLRTSMALLLAAVLSGCGDEPQKPAAPPAAMPPAAPPAAPTGGPMTVSPLAPTPAEATKARLTALFEVVKAGSPAAAAPFVVYRGDDKARAWKSLSNYADEAEKRRVDGVFTETWALLQLGAPRFLTFKTEKQSEGQWLVWEVAFGEGENARKAHFACLDVKGIIAIGDID